MSKKTAFVEFVLDQLSEITGVRAQAMFGGTGLYCNDVFFGIIHRDVFYLKVNDDTRAVFQRAGMKPFKPYAGQAMTMGYYEVPLAVLENPPDLAVWAKRAVAVAAAGRPKRPAKGSGGVFGGGPRKPLPTPLPNRSRRPARHKASK